jgi:hypothetical protein
LRREIVPGCPGNLWGPAERRAEFSRLSRELEAELARLKARRLKPR